MNTMKPDNRVLIPSMVRFEKVSLIIRTNLHFFELADRLQQRFPKNRPRSAGRRNTCACGSVSVNRASKRSGSPGVSRTTAASAQA